MAKKPASQPSGPRSRSRPLPPLDDVTLAKHLTTLANEYIRYYHTLIHIGERWMVPKVLRAIASHLATPSRDDHKVLRALGKKKKRRRIEENLLWRLWKATTTPPHRPPRSVTREQVESWLIWIIPLCQRIKNTYRALKQPVRKERVRELVQRDFDGLQFSETLLSQMAPWKNSPTKMAAVLLTSDEGAALPIKPSAILRRRTHLK